MKLFEKFVYCRNKGAGMTAEISNKTIKDEFVKYYRKGALVNWNYYCNGYSYDENLLWNAIDSYLKKLNNLYFVIYEAEKYRCFLEQTHSLRPPNSKYANLLKEALLVVDCFSNEASKQIDCYIDQYYVH